MAPRRFSGDNIRDDNFVFQLHYRVTVWLCLILGFLLGLIYYTTDNIKCIDLSEIGSLLCWSHGQLTLGSLPSSNIQLSFTGNTTMPPPVEDQKRYQLIFCKLIFHAVFFYLPRILWKLWEGDKIKSIAKDLDRINSEEIESLKDSAITFVAEYVRQHSTAHNVRLVLFTVCELLNFINVVAHLSLLDNHLGDILSTHGSDVIGLTNLDHNTRTDRLLELFPRMVKCKYLKHGASGILQNHSTLCLLPNNSLNEKVLVVVLVWLLVLSVLSGLALVYRIVLLASSDVRVHVLGARCRHLPRNKVSRAVSGPGDWFLLYQLSKNVGIMEFTELVKEMGATHDVGKSGIV